MVKGPVSEQTEKAIAEATQQAIAEIRELIIQACERGDTVRAIARRAGVDENEVYRLKNDNYRGVPRFSFVVGLAEAIGSHIKFSRLRKKSDSRQKI